MIRTKKRWEIKEWARELRRKGLSYREIREQIPVAKSTVSNWCKDVELTPKQLSRLDNKRREGGYIGRLKGAKTNQLKRAQEVERIKAIAASEIPPLTKEEFRIAGLMLYWAEGAKTDRVGFSNSDPAMMRFMIKWFMEICGVPSMKFRALLHLHSGQNERRMKKFWSKITEIPLSQFGKSYIKKEGTGHRKNVLYNGTLRIAIYDGNLFHKIHGWIEGIKLANNLLDLKKVSIFD